MMELLNYPIHDLTLTLHSGMRGVEYETARQLDRDGWNAQTLHLYSHVGTHMDAPLHFGLEGTIDQFTPRQCMSKAWVVPVPVEKSHQLITSDDLGEVKDRLGKGESLLLKTGWSNHIGTDLYRDGLPRISEELAEWCCERGVHMLGVEPPSVADVNKLPELTQIHRILLGGGIIIVEGLSGLEAIHSQQVLFIALPLKIFQGDGAPARAIAIELTE